MKIIQGVALLAALLPLMARAQTEDANAAPATIPVPAAAADETPAMPEDLPLLDAQFNANLQQDGLASASLPSDRTQRTRLRRARLSAVIDYQFDWEARIALDFADRSQVLRELSVEYRTDDYALEAGRMIEPFSLLQSSSTASPFMERPLALGLAPGYGLGGALSTHGDRWGVSGGVFSSTRNDVFFGGRSERGLTLRATGVPLSGPGWLVHAGAAFSHRSSSEDFLQFVAVPETVMLQGMNVDSALLFTQDYNLFGLETAALWGPLLVEGEWLKAKISDSVRLDFNTDEVSFNSPSYSGWYLETSWAITGEHRDYSVRHGNFSGIEPAHGWGHGGYGAWLLGARASSLDLRSPGIGSSGSKGTVLSLSLSWLPDPRLRATLEGLRIKRDGVDSSASASAVQLRLQLYFADFLAGVDWPAWGK